MKNLVVRSLSGIVYVALIIGAILAGEAWFFALTLLFGLLAAVEFEHIVLTPVNSIWHWTVRILDTVTALAVITLPLFLELPHVIGDTCLGIVLLYTLARFTIALYDKSPTAYRDCAWSCLMLAYVALPLAMLNLLTHLAPQWQIIVLTMFIMIWLNDTGAYCVGSMIGKKRMFPRLSPKKSWEGFAGGLACCIGAGVGAYYMNTDIFSLPAWIAFGIIVCAFSTWGDLFESLLKRSHAIKDSGNLIPGHGGILDRIDSMLFVSMATVLFYLIML